MSKTLRLLMPQWQGGNNPAYSFGARLLDWLAPGGENAETVEIPVEPPTGAAPVQENGIVARAALLKQLKAAATVIKARQPEKIIVFGGDCLVEQAPFSYLNERYNGELGVLWLDAHPDVATPAAYPHGHAMVLGNLLGAGDAEFAAFVKKPLNPKLVMMAGLQKTFSHETEVLDRLGIRRAGPLDLAQSSAPVLNWLAENRIKHLAVHLDLDVLSARVFRSLLCANPLEPCTLDAEWGDMDFAQLGRLLEDVAARTELVGFGITEYTPWDALNLRALLAKVPIFA